MSLLFCPPWLSLPPRLRRLRRPRRPRRPLSSSWLLLRPPRLLSRLSLPRLSPLRLSPSWSPLPLRLSLPRLSPPRLSLRSLRRLLLRPPRWRLLELSPRLSFEESLSSLLSRALRRLSLGSGPESGWSSDALALVGAWVSSEPDWSFRRAR